MTTMKCLSTECPHDGTVPIVIAGRTEVVCPEHARGMRVVRDAIHDAARAWAAREIRDTAAATILNAHEIRALAGAAYEAGLRAGLSERDNERDLSPLLEASIAQARAKRER